MVSTSLRLLVVGAVERILAKHPGENFSLADVLAVLRSDLGPDVLDQKRIEIFATVVDLPNVEPVGVECWRPIDPARSPTKPAA